MGKGKKGRGGFACEVEGGGGRVCACSSMIFRRKAPRVVSLPSLSSLNLAVLPKCGLSQASSSLGAHTCRRYMKPMILMYGESGWLSSVVTCGLVSCGQTGGGGALLRLEQRHAGEEGGVKLTIKPAAYKT